MLCRYNFLLLWFASLVCLDRFIYAGKNLRKMCLAVMLNTQRVRVIEKVLSPMKITIEMTFSLSRKRDYILFFAM